MKVQCGQCPAKYAVADDRIREKKVRIHCKRCNAAIIVDGKVDPPLVTTTPARPSANPSRPSSSPAPEAPAPEVTKPVSPRPVAHTIMGGLEAPAAARLAEVARPGPPPKPARGRRGLTPPSSPRVDPSRGRPAEDRGLTDPPEGDDERWRVALTQNDLRWMTTDEIGEAYRAGAVQLETFVFRAGMATWVTLLEVPELASALGHAFVEAPPLGSIGAHAAALDGGAHTPPSSGPPLRKAPGSRPDAAVQPLAPMRSAADDPLPFALVGRNDAGRGPNETTESPRAANAEPPARVPAPFDGVSSLPTPLVPPPADVALPPIPAPAPAPALGAEPINAEPPKGKSSAWTWIVLALVLLVAIVAFFGPRFGLRFR